MRALEASTHRPGPSAEPRRAALKIRKCNNTLDLMDILNMLAELRAERDRLSEAIIVVERLAIGAGGKRRGRPPKWMAAAATTNASATEPRKRRRFSAATRRKMAEAQKRRWAAKKPQQKAA